MWVMVMFDLPVVSKPDRHAAVKFRNWLLDQGFEMSQFSIYLRFCAGKEQVDRHVRAIEKAHAGKGNVHVLAVTDRQFSQMTVLRGHRKLKGRANPDQLSLF